MAKNMDNSSSEKINSDINYVLQREHVQKKEGILQPS